MLRDCCRQQSRNRFNNTYRTSGEAEDCITRANFLPMPPPSKMEKRVEKPNMSFIPSAPLRLHGIPQISYLTRLRHYTLPRRATLTPPRATATNPTKIEEVSPASTDALITELEPYLPEATTLPLNLLHEIVHHLGDPRGMARLTLVEALGKIGTQAVPHLLESLSNHPNPVVRRSSGKALAKIADPAALPVLLNTLVKDPDTVTRSSAAGALARMGPCAVPALISLISDTEVSRTAKGYAAWAIAFMKDSSDALLESLRHPSVDVRIAVVSALGALAIGDALPAMGAGAEDDWGDSDKAMQERAVDALREGLDDADAGVRAEATTALANAGCVDEAGRIADMLDDNDMELRRCSALALMKLGDTAFVDVLRQREETEQDQGVRNVLKLAADNLERITEQGDD